MPMLRCAGAGHALLALLAVAGCGADPSEPDPVGADASIRVSANVSNTPIDILVVTVSSGDIVTPPTFNLAVVAGVASGTLHIPPGTARTFTVTAYDANGEVTHDGAATRDVQRGQNPPLSIPLTPRSGHVPITITFGEYSVVVSPAATEIDLTAMLPLQLTVTVTDPDGQVVASPPVSWATTDPSRAQVNAQGVVMGLLAGEVDIVATYNGIAGISHVTLTGALPTFWYPDLDVDGFGDDTGAIPAIVGENPPAGYVAVGGDCRDAIWSVNPGRDEVYDSVDNDCDGVSDELVTVSVFPDNDGDFWGGQPELIIQTDENGTVPIPDGFVFIGQDCNDADASINPSVAEAADGVNNDCDGLTDEIWYVLDLDQDGYGHQDWQSEFEDPPEGYIVRSTSLGWDCDDASSATNPGAIETPADGVDNNCDGFVD